MDLQDAIKVLDYHQRWRQGIEEDMKYKPLQLTEALDIVLEQVKKLNIEDVSNQRELLIAYAKWTTTMEEMFIEDSEKYVDDFIKESNL